MSPEAYAARFQNIQVNTLTLSHHQAQAGPVVPIAVNKYRNEFIDSGRRQHVISVQHGLGAEIRRWIGGCAATQRLGMNGSLSQLTIMNALPPIFNVDARLMMAPFMGKASWEVAQTTLRLVSLWMAAHPDRANRWQGSLQIFADQELGTDCNGFVGAFLNDAFPALFPNLLDAAQMDLNSSWPGRLTPRQRLEDVSALDIVLSADGRDGPTWEHIGIISSVSQPRVQGEQVELTVRFSESQSPTTRGAGTSDKTFRQSRVPRRDGQRPPIKINGHAVQIGRIQALGAEGNESINLGNISGL